jgi:endogenous inhibitor of DNA gyrase (YacG/DUF329 family)
MNEIENSGHLCSVYCPDCGKVTDKISFNLLRDAGRVTAYCPICQNITWLKYNGKMVSVSHPNKALEYVLSKEEKKNFNIDCLDPALGCL